MTNDVADGFPADLCSVTEQASAVTLTVDSGLYPIGALYGAAYIFIDRCFVMLGRPDRAHYAATLAWKKGAPPEGALRDLAGEFMNELLSCAWRAKINEENRSIIEAVTAQAFAGAMGPPSLDDLEKFDFSEEAFEDPLGIAMSWEDKYGKKKAAQEAAPPAEAATAEPAKPTPELDGAISASAPTEPEAHLIELRFHREIYRGTSLDEAVKVFAAHAAFELKEEPEHWLVRVTAAAADRERRIAGEFGNYALGLTVRAGGAERPAEKVS